MKGKRLRLSIWAALVSGLFTAAITLALAQEQNVLPIFSREVVPVVSIATISVIASFIIILFVTAILYRRLVPVTDRVSWTYHIPGRIAASILMAFLVMVLGTLGLEIVDSVFPEIAVPFIEALILLAALGAAGISCGVVAYLTLANLDEVSIFYADGYSFSTVGFLLAFPLVFILTSEDLENELKYIVKGKRLMKKFGMLLIFLLFATSVTVAQDDPIVQNATTETVNISWPPPVTEVWGTGDVLGTAAVPGMAYYYLEYIALNDDLSIPENAPWLPATVGITQPVVNGTLATLDTTTVPDGVYVLRLTVNTVDGQSYNDTVWPIRVDNERFNAILAGTGDEETPEPAPTQATGDTTARVVPNAQYTAINIRRCDLVDNDRCPIIAALRSGEFALVQAVSSNGSNWFQVQLPSGTVGWVSPTVVTQQGDFSGVGRTQPPAPLPPVARPPQQNIAPVGQASAVVPNGVAIEGGTATCDRTFNVQVNVANSGNTVSPAGTVTLQDVNVSTGEVTFTGYGNYPTLNPGANFVVVIPARTTVHFNEDHELRAYTNGRQFNTRYQLQRGDCGQSSSSNNDNTKRTQRTFGRNECQIEVTDNGETYFSPEGGEVAFILSPGTYPARQIKRVGGVNWFEVEFADATTWIVGRIIQHRGNCGLNN